MQDHVLSLRHIYQRNPLIASLGRFRSNVFQNIGNWFNKHDFLDFSAPLITPSLLYEPSAAVHRGYLKYSRPLYHSQCASFYFEAAAHAYERVDNLSPRFRNEKRTNQHSIEYWHIKAVLASGTMDDIIDLVGILLGLATEPPKAIKELRDIDHQNCFRRLLHLYYHSA